MRLDVRRIDSIKNGTDIVGNRVRVKVVKNKMAAPFKLAEFDIMYDGGASREGCLLDVAVDLAIVKKSGAWFTYEGEHLGQGRENVKDFLTDNPDIALELSERIREVFAPKEPEADAEAAAETADLDVIEALDASPGN